MVSTIPRMRIGGVSSEQSQFEQFLTHPVKINHDTWSGSTLLSGVITKDIVALWKSSLSTNMAKKWRLYGISLLRCVFE